jgi:hypothetical protein
MNGNGSKPAKADNARKSTGNKNRKNTLAAGSG